MQTTVYVDVLLVLNYIITALLVAGTAKLLGIQSKRSKIVAAALLGSVSSLTIFLPFFGFVASIVLKLLISGIIVLAGLPYDGFLPFLRRWFLFFAVNFFFAGVMLGIWMGFAPQGMVYYNGVVYFDVSALTLLAATVAAYLLLALAGRLSRAARLRGGACRAVLYFRGNACVLRALVDTGNELCEPFSGFPVIVCPLGGIRRILPGQVGQAVERGEWEEGFREAGIALRVIPFDSVGGRGALPAFRPDRLVCEQNGRRTRTEEVYVAISREPVADGRYDALLGPGLLGVTHAGKPG